MECLHCKTTGASLMVCGDCKKAIMLAGDPPLAHYCNAACQKADWKNHKDHCHRLRDRTLVYRVGELAQRLYYQHREITWCQAITSIKVEGSDIHVTGTTGKVHVWPTEFRAFPRELLPSKTTNKKLRETRKNQLKAILCFISGCEAVDWVQEFVVAPGLLGDLVKTFQKVCCQVKNAQTGIILSKAANSQSSQPTVDNRTIDHSVMKIQLHSGESFAIDLAGIQFGYAEPVVPWKEYHETRVGYSYARVLNPAKGILTVAGSSLIGQARDLINSMQNVSRTPLESVLKNMNTRILIWQKGTNCSLKQMLEMQEGGYKERIQNLLDYVEYGCTSDFQKVGCYTVKGKDLQQRVKGVWKFDEN